jgi:phosphoribosylanthranilate isomerase
MSSGPGVIADSLIAEIAAWVGGRAATVLLTSRQSAEEIVGEAIATVHPFGVDVCSGVRHDGRLDATLVQAFIQATRLVA